MSTIIHLNIYNTIDVQVCTRRNWWGRCVSEEEKITAVWRKPLPYYN